MIEFKLPDIGEGTVEGEIVRWLVKPGDAVKADQPVVEVMTDKATVELTAPKAGRIVELRAEAGKVAKVGSVIYLLDDAGGGAAAAPAAAAPSAAARPAAAAAHAAAGGDGSRGGNGGGRHAGGATATAAAAPAPAPAPGPGGPERKPLATPATRKLARELGVELARVRGTGPNGRVTDDDVRAAASGAEAPLAVAPRPVVQRAIAEVAAAAEAPGPAAAPAPTAAPAATFIGGEEPVERISFRGVRKAIAAQMTRSKFTATHYTYVEEVDMTEIVRLRDEVKEEAKAKGVKLTYLPFIAKAVVAALKKHPILNSELDEKSQEIVLKRYYHLGFSIQADAGLSVGVARHVDRRSIYDLARELERLVTEVRAGKAKAQDLKGSTFTITSAGNIGGVLATPIINFPEVAILGVNQIKKRPVVRTNAAGEDEIVIRHMMFLSISLDHRIVDGAVAAHFMNDVVYLLERPNRLFLEV
jgi:pyruvate dehydrogenase E2 component (dihydrolipoamide acetyltransferase)